MNYSKIKLDLIASGLSQREVREECIRRGYKVNHAQVNTALDVDLCKTIQDIATEMVEQSSFGRAQTMMEIANGNS